MFSFLWLGHSTCFQIKLEKAHFFEEVSYLPWKLNSAGLATLREQTVCLQEEKASHLSAYV